MLECAVRFWLRGLQRHLAPIFGGRRHRAKTAREIVSFLYFQPVHVFSITKEIKFAILFTIFDFNNLQSIETAEIKTYLNCLSLMYSCFLPCWCLVTKTKKKLRTNRLLKSVLKTLTGWMVEASESAKYCG